MREVAHQKMMMHVVMMDVMMVMILMIVTMGKMRNMFLPHICEQCGCYLGGVRILNYKYERLISVFCGTSDAKNECFPLIPARLRFVTIPNHLTRSMASHSHIFGVTI